jgi:hypothetical protein
MDEWNLKTLSIVYEIASLNNHPKIALVSFAESPSLSTSLPFNGTLVELFARILIELTLLHRCC